MVCTMSSRTARGYTEKPCVEKQSKAKQQQQQQFFDYPSLSDSLLSMTPSSSFFFLSPLHMFQAGLYPHHPFPSPTLSLSFSVSK